MPVTTRKALPDEARKIPDTRHPDASIRAAVLLNCSVSALAIRLKMWVGDKLHGPVFEVEQLLRVGRRIEQRLRPAVAGADVERVATGIALRGALAGRPRVVGVGAQAVGRALLAREQHAVVRCHP